MVLARVSVVALIMLLGWPTSGRAQETSDQRLLNERHLELVAWLEDYRRWEAFYLKWGNRVAYNAAGAVVKKRPVRPEPPDWLWDDCARAVASDGALGDACAILSEWDHLTERLAAGRPLGHLPASAEASPKTSFLQRVHLSGGWVPAQLPAPKIYLAVGMQIGVVEIGRVTLPAVGVGLMALANGDNGYDWKPATVMGVGYRVSTFPFPGIRREASLHINVARVTIHGVRDLPIGIDPSQNFVGFSLTFRKAP